MKKSVLIIFLLFIMTSVFSQAQSTLTVNFDQTSLKDALIKLEEQSGYKFYFQEDWFQDTKSITETYTQQPLNKIIASLLKDSDLNFLIQNNAVIFTKNSIIYSELPSNYFNEDRKTTNSTYVENSEDIDANVEAPVLQKYYVREHNSTKTEYTAIGRADIQKSSKLHVISGAVTDYITKKPVLDIVVAVKGKNTNAVTDEKGHYSLKLPQGTYELFTKSLAYENSIRNIVVYGSGELNFDLVESLNQLGEIVIASNKRDNIKEAMVGITTIDVKEIKNIPLVLGERDVLKVATTMPGIKTAGEGAMGYNVRGGKADQNLILFDHAVMYNPSHFFGIFSAINPFATGNVKIYKGTIPAEFGGRLSSVIDIQTKESNIEKFVGEGSI